MLHRSKTYLLNVGIDHAVLLCQVSLISIPFVTASAGNPGDAFFQVFKKYLIIGLIPFIANLIALLLCPNVYLTSLKRNHVRFVIASVLSLGIFFINIKLGMANRSFDAPWRFVVYDVLKGSNLLYSVLYFIIILCIIIISLAPLPYLKKNLR